MKYGLLAKAMWRGYQKTFYRQLTDTFHEENPMALMKEAKRRYKKILSYVDEFEKGDRFVINILSCSMLDSVLLTAKNKYSLEEVREYYRKAMTENFLTKAFSKTSRSYTAKGRKKLKEQARKSQDNRNPYSWKFRVEDGKTLNQYTAYFDTCGICHLMTELGMKEYIPALCHLDYDMAALNHTIFTREFTLAGGGKYCDCHYDHQGGKGKA